ncbi:hypothetical protein CORC01_03902 [Colletotrichum orchidophilum]|uniref:Uncharacterized protein n=1 Tax=Colletotrichum orchidophilum TaxID=1209926 RepID=A0A1G4BHP9_9PEZI|nr:uncharacterized protein CORC01_03902 [Colletotrichum orchidophilum]OHF00828.1 hypothetical protein CORC01_03902 [Colletotrichum orchidophilum]
MTQPNDDNDDDDYIFPDVPKPPNEGYNHSLTVTKSPTSPVSSGWTVLEDPDGSFDAISEPKDDEESSAQSLCASNNTTPEPKGKLPLPTPSTKVTIPGPATTSQPTYNNKPKQSPLVFAPSQLPPISRLRPLEQFSEQDFNGGTTESLGAGPSQGNLKKDGLNPTGSLRGEVLRSERLSQQDKAHEQYYRQLLRSRAVQSNYRARDLEDRAGKAPDADWRWCGFPECQNDACRYGNQKQDTQAIVAARDLGRDCDILKDFLDTFRSQTWSYYTEVHCRVSFATSPPVMRAVAHYLTHLANQQDDTMEMLFAVHYSQATARFVVMSNGFTGMDERQLERIHIKEMDSDVDDQDSIPTPRVILQFIMRLEAWRQRQIKEGYPWDWPLSDALKMYKIILETYRQTDGRGYSLLKDVDKKAQDKAWLLWWDRHRPWTSSWKGILEGILFLMLGVMRVWDSTSRIGGPIGQEHLEWTHLYSIESVWDIRHCLV